MIISIKLSSGAFTYDKSKPLGKPGGFGQVFSGSDSNGNTVAIKKLHVSAADAAHRELDIAKELNTRKFEHVLPCIDSGEDADSGDYYLVMPKAEKNLTDEIQNTGAKSTIDTVNILLEISQGLTEVSDIVHRDLKPDNILKYSNKWMIADFGIARFIEDVTASNTLKDCLSPYYAAPEQWRFGRATHATDIYALGCIGFYLLAGSPPYVKNPESQHQKDPLPQFVCDDGRLRALINNMVRKLPETRPALSRVLFQLQEMVANPQITIPNPLSILANAGAEIAEKEQQQQAKIAAENSVKEARLKHGRAAFEILSENVERLWGKIHKQAANAQRGQGQGGNAFQCNLGKSSLVVNLSTANIVAPGTFSHSGWDVIASSQILASQREPEYVWSSSLWYAKIRNSSEFRWYEVSYWTFPLANKRPQFEPYACSASEADVASSNIMGMTNIAFGPVAIDDEAESNFHERWIWLLAKAASGHLRHPSSMPIHNWPPQF